MRDITYYKKLFNNVGLEYIDKSHSLRFKGIKLRSYLNPPYKNNKEYYISAKKYDSKFYSEEYWEQVKDEDLKLTDLNYKYPFTGFKPVKGLEVEALNDFLSKFFKLSNKLKKKSSNLSLFINGAYESVLKAILEIQNNSEKQELYIQPYSKRLIAELKKNPPSVESPIKLYLSTSDNLNIINYEGLIINWEDKRYISDERRKVVREHIEKWQPYETGYKLTGEDGYNLLTIKNLNKVEWPFHVSSLIKTSNKEPCQERTQAGSWSYVTKSKVTNFKLPFQDEINSTNRTGSGKANSYTKAIEYLGPILSSYSPEYSNLFNIWEIDSVDQVKELYEYVLKHQKLGSDGIFKDKDKKSYWRDGYYSAALKSYMEFLVDYKYHQKLELIINDESLSDEELSKKLLEVEVEEAEKLSGLDFSNKEGKEVYRNIKTRSNQSSFRKMILHNYQNKCCITGLNIPQVLRASHIIAWADMKKTRMNPTNGLCLSATYDAAFDRHLISLDENFRMILSKDLKEHYTKDVVKEYFHNFEGKKILLPIKYQPKQEYLAKHRKKLTV